MAPSILALFTACVTIYIIFKSVSFWKNYKNARLSKFPIYVSPILSRSIAWLVLGAALRPLYRRCLPDWVAARVDVTINGWEFHRKSEYYDKLGKTFVLVTPDECTLWVADPDLGNVILQRRKDFTQTPLFSKILGFLGPNVISSNGDDWQRQRKLVAANLNETISKIVWNESCSQANAMLKYMIQHPGSQTLPGLHVIAKNVIGRAGYGTSTTWEPAHRQPIDSSGNASAAYFQTISLIVANFLPAALLPLWFMKLPFMPTSLQNLADRMSKLPGHVKKVLEEQRHMVSDQRHGNFLSLLVRLSDQEKKTSGTFLTDEEISGNLFAFTAAGFDTTANTMGYAVILLTVYPEWQEWIRQELSDLDVDMTNWRYEDIYPKCPRLLALMHETLRQFPAALHSTRYVGHTQEVVDSNGSHLLTASMDALISHMSIHSDQAIWGDDVLQFRPSRWIDSAGQLITPPKGTFVPWSSGPRICPGIKIAQVEFVATLATLFRSARCEPFTTGSEDPERL